MVTSTPLLSSTIKETQTTSDTLLTSLETSRPIISTTIPVVITTMPVIRPSIVSSIVYTTISNNSPSPVLLSSSSTSEYAIETNGISGMTKMD